MEDTSGQFDEDALALARSFAGDLSALGAAAVVLTGSHARGSAHAESDIDLHAIGSGKTYQLVRRAPYLISISWRTAAEHCASFSDIREVGGTIPGWRTAKILADPDGVAAELQAEARTWTWGVVGTDAGIDRAVADWVVGFAEEVHKLTYARAQGDRLLAAVQRSVLATRLALPMAVHHRILHDSENDLWRLACEAMGSEWARAQEAALSTNGESFETTCDAAVALFAIASRTVRDRMTLPEVEVVEHALSVAGAR